MAEETNTASGGVDGDAKRDDEDDSLESLPITMDKRLDLAVSLAVALTGLVILILATGIRKGLIPDPITSRGLPNAMGGMLLLFGIILAYKQIRHWKELPGNLVPEEGQADEEGHPASWIRAFGIIVMSLAWGWLLKPVGFIIMTALYLFVSELVMSVKSKWKLVLFPIIFSFLVWTIFWLLGLTLPLGPLAPVFRSLGIIW